MKKYKVLINGMNLLLDMDGKVGKHGFHTPRFVAAYNDSSAKEIALKDFVAEPKWEDLLGRIQNQASDPHRIFVAEIEEVESFDGIANRHPGYAFYRENIQ